MRTSAAVTEGSLSAAKKARLATATATAAAGCVELQNTTLRADAARSFSAVHATYCGVGCIT